jgi:hypothetical protein
MIEKYLSRWRQDSEAIIEATIALSQMSIGDVMRLSYVMRVSGRKAIFRGWSRVFPKAQCKANQERTNIKERGK